MSSPSPYVAPRSFAHFPSAKHPSMYRQTDYHDGRGFQLIESRRRSPPSSVTKSASKIDALASSSRKDQSISSGRSHKASTQPCHPRSISTDQSPKLGSHVSSRSSKSSSHVVIVQGLMSVSVDFGKKGVAIDLSTPPPTPKFERLPTPELDDLDERPFCDCCTGMQVVRYCATCGCELKR